MRSNFSHPRLLQITLSLCLCAGLLTACSEPEDTHPGQPVKTRQAAFKALLRSFEPMGTMLRTQRYDAKAFKVLAEQMKETEQAPWSHFGPDTAYPPSKAKPEVWSDSATFEKEKEAFLKATSAFHERVEQSAQLPEIEAAYQKVYDACQSCHKQFKQK